MADRDQKSKEDFLAKIRDNRKVAVDAMRKVYAKSLEDMRFVYDVEGAQWPEGLDSKIKLTANNLQKFIRQIRADARQNRPRLKVVPVDDFADVRMAELRNGLIRQIEHLSNADIAYDTAYAQAVAGSIGYFRILTEFEDPLSFNQIITIERVRNPYSIHFDPAARKFNKEDAMWAFVDEWIRKDEFKRMHPGAAANDFEIGSQGQNFEGWFEPDKVRVAEYYFKKRVEFTLALVRREFEDGSVGVQAMELTDQVKENIRQTKSNIVNERQSFRFEVKRAKVTGLDILEETDWPTEDIPIVPVQGDEIVIDGEVHLLSFGRGANDLQRMLNFWLTKATKIMAKTPDVPFLLTPDQINGHENMWNETRDRRYLLYNSGPEGKPSRERAIDPPVGMLSMIQTMANGIEDHLGLFEASKGAPSNERSRVAIDRRIQQSQKGSFVFVDNYARALIYANKIINRLIPKIYDTQRALQVRGEEGDVRLEQFNQPIGEIDRQGNPIVLNDLSVGKFDIIETLAASSVSRRQEERQDLLEALQYAGPVAPALIPIIFELSDSPNSKRVTEAVKEFTDALKQGQQTQRQT